MNHSIVPNFFKVTLSEGSSYRETKSPDGFLHLVSFEYIDGKYKYNNIFNKIYKNIAWYFNSHSNIGSSIRGYVNPIEFIKKYNLLDEQNQHDFKLLKSFGVYGAPLNSGVAFKEKESALAFIAKINEALIKDYEELESKLQISLFLSNKSIDEVSSSPKDIIVGTKHLASYFSGEFKSKYFFRTFKVIEIQRESPFALELKIRIHTDVCGQCHICGKALTDEFSQKTGIGPICARKYLGLTGKSVEETVKKIKEIAESYGEIGPIIIPKSQIRKL